MGTSILAIIGFFALFVFLIFLLAFPSAGILYLLWKFVICSIFTVKMLTFWQCYGIVFVLWFIGGFFRSVSSSSSSS